MPKAALARLAAEAEAIAVRIAAAEAGRGTIDIRTVEAEDRARDAEATLAQARAVQAAQLAEARVARAALESAQAKLARADAEAARLAAQMGELDDAGPLSEARDEAISRRDAAERQGGRRPHRRRRCRAPAPAGFGRARPLRKRGRLGARRAGRGAGRGQGFAQGGRGARRRRAGDRQGQGGAGYERALAAALGDDLDAVLEGEGARRWSGAQPTTGDPALPTGLEPLADHVEAPAALRRRLAQIGIADSDDGGTPLAVGQRLVTRDGYLRRWDGFVATGLGAAAAERLIRLNRLAEIERLLPQAAATVERAERERETAAAAIAAARDAADAARRAEADATGAIRDATRAEDAANVALERLELRRTGLAERAAAADHDLAEARRAAADAESAVAALPDAAAGDADLARLKALAEAAQLGLAEIRAEAATHARAIGADKQRADAILKELADWRGRGAEAAKRHAEFGARLADAEAEHARIADAPARLDGEVAAVEADYGKAGALVEDAAAAERAGEATFRQAESLLGDRLEALASAREARAGAAARAENQENRRIEMARISGERFHCPPVLLPERQQFDAAGIAAVTEESATLDRLTLERERIGPVNLVAEQELAELEEQYAVSENERDELTEAIHRLRGSIGSLNREGRARLLAAFEEVDRHFRSLFTTLFEGGQAHLALVESDDPLEAGLEIMAQPPGKRLSMLTLLSGGEQALTAVALIFALFLTNPAPICVLDEVDAPLDDANIERFCDLLDRMSGETDTRYLIVTHNAVTMARMHRLFGVTMVERGVSRLVSVDLGGAERLLAAE